MSTEILPCPFCGGVVSDGGSGKYQMVCRDCGYSSAGYQTEADAIDAHNEIAAAVRGHAALTAERDALKAHVAQYQRAFGEFGTEELKLLVSMDDLIAATAPKEAPDA